MARFSNEQGNVVTARLKTEYVTNNKKMNTMKIMSQVVNDGMEADNIFENSFTAIDLEYEDREKANKCLELEDNVNKKITYSIAKRNIQAKGVITSWDGEVEELSKIIMEKDKLVSLERLRKRVYRKNDNKYEWELTKHIIITWNEARLPDEIKVYQGKVSISMRPFVESVIQCY